MSWRRESPIELYNLFFGIFLLVSPWLFAYVSEAVRLDAWISGALIAVLSVAAMVAFSDWEEWFNLALGFWLIASPWILGFAHTRAMHVCIGTGVVVVFMAALQLWLVKYDPDYASHRPELPKSRN